MITLKSHIESVNGRAFGSVEASQDGTLFHSDRLDLTSANCRKKFADEICRKLAIQPADIAATVDEIDALLLVELNRLRNESVESDTDDGHDDDDDDSRKDEKEQRLSQSTVLVGLADGVEFFRCDDTAYATVFNNDHKENHPVNAKGFRLWLQRRYYESFKRAPSSQALQDALGVLAGKALFEGKNHTTAVRVGKYGDAIYIDICNDKWQAVEITAQGWQVVSDVPIKFIRRRGMLPLPTPVSGGTLDELRPLANASDDATWTLLASWLVGALNATGPYTVLALNGEQGSAKSTTCRMLRMLIDPNTANLRAAPRDDRDLLIAASNSWVVCFDNLSDLRDWLSDGCCRLATGGGFATRELFTDGEEKIFEATRPILINGIEEVATRPDLLERSITLTLPPIPDDRRVDEDSLWKQFHETRPRILGALLDAVVMALRNLPTVKLDVMPRMADFCRWVVAAEPALPWTPGNFMAAYNANRAAGNDLALEASPVAAVIVKLMEGKPEWTGTATQLLKELDSLIDEAGKRRPDWPKTARGLSGAIKRITPALRRGGIVVTQAARTEKARQLHIEHIGKQPSEPSFASAESKNPPGATENSIFNDDRNDGHDGSQFQPSAEPSCQKPHLDAENAIPDGHDGHDGSNPHQSNDPMDDLSDADLEALRQADAGHYLGRARIHDLASKN